MQILLTPMSLGYIIGPMFNVIILGIATFLADVSTEMVYPLLPLFLTSASIGATPAIVGLIQGLAGSTASLIRVFSHDRLDRLAEYKPFTILGHFASTIGLVLLYLATSWPVVLAARLTDQLGKGIRTAPQDGLVASSSDPARRLAPVWRQALRHAGVIVGVILALLLFNTFGGGFTLVFGGAIFPSILGVLALVLVRERQARRTTPNHEDGASGEPRSPWWYDLREQWQALDRQPKVLLSIFVIFALGNSSTAFLLLRAQNLLLTTNLSTHDVNAAVLLMYLVLTLVCAIVSWPVGRLSGRVENKLLLVLGYLTYSVVYIGFAIANPLQLWGLFATYGIFAALTRGVERALVTDMAPFGQGALLLGLHSAIVGVSLLPACLLAGFLWEAFGPPATFYFGGVMAALAGIALWRMT